mgnify:CR=1 FL=1
MDNQVVSKPLLVMQTLEICLRFTNWDQTNSRKAKRDKLINKMRDNNNNNTKES